MSDTHHPPTVILSLGANINHPITNLRHAITQLAATPLLKGITLSSIYETSPLHELNQPPFYNMVLYAEATAQAGTVSELFRVCQGIENRLGRQKTTPKGPRNIDIDVILYGTTMGAFFVGQHPLIVPHPRYIVRKFVLVPLLELETQLGKVFRHPVLGTTTRELLTHPARQRCLSTQTIKKHAPFPKDFF